MLEGELLELLLPDDTDDEEEELDNVLTDCDELLSHPWSIGISDSSIGISESSIGITTQNDEDETLELGELESELTLLTDDELLELVSDEDDEGDDDSLDAEDTDEETDDGLDVDVLLDDEGLVELDDDVIELDDVLNDELVELDDELKLDALD
jgi:hypothetical protein